MMRGPVITGVVATVAMVGVVSAFLKSASPYAETIAVARKSSDDRLHLAGDIVKNSVHNDISTKTVRFELRDPTGEIIQVVHKGEPPANMGEATKVVAIGKIQGNEFRSVKLLVKCPSKYEGEQSSKGSEKS